MGFTATHFYLVCLLLGLAWAIFSVVMGQFFDHDIAHGHDGIDLNASGSIDIHADVGTVEFSPLSPTVISMFMASFGGAGIVCRELFQTSFITSLTVAIICGLCFGSITYFFFTWMFEKVQGGVDVRVCNLVGIEAEVSTPIPENGVGEINYVAGGARVSSPARTMDGSPLKCHEIVKVIKIVGASFVVEKIGNIPNSKPNSDCKAGEESSAQK